MLAPGNPGAARFRCPPYDARSRLALARSSPDTERFPDTERRSTLSGVAKRLSTAGGGGGRLAPVSARERGR